MFANLNSPDLRAEKGQLQDADRSGHSKERDLEDEPCEIEILEGDFWELYKPLSTLGKGSTAIVKKVQCRQTKQKFAVKIVRTSDLECISRSVEEFRRIYKLSHHSIVKMHRMYIDEGQGYVYTVMEFCTYKSLSEWTIEADYLKKFDEACCRKVFGKLVAAVKVLHTRGIVHRDLTPDNFLISEEGNVKLIDFNVAKFFSWESVRLSPRKKHKFKYHMMTQTGNPKYRAPEIVLGGIYR